MLLLISRKASLCTKRVVLSCLVATGWCCSAAAFSPAASPRFDVFAERVLGQWSSSSNGSGDTNRGNQGLPLEVTEVMRSCGGAVQGVREVALLDAEGMYLNRANDGWAYWEDTSYSIGPVKVSTEEDTETEFWTSLSLGKQSRLLVSVQWSPSSAPVLQPYLLARAGREKVVALEKGDGKRPDAEVEWLYRCRCRMSSPSQPWMLQRVKWESDGKSIAWSDNDFNRIQPWVHLEKGDLGSIAVGVFCLDSGLVSAVCREYQVSGSLGSISYMQGRTKAE